MSRIDQALKHAGARVPATERVASRSDEDLNSFASVPEAPAQPVRRDEPPRLIDPDSNVSARVVADRLVVHENAAPVAIEQYRRMAAVLHHAQVERNIKIVMVASAQPSEGKTLTAANLALTLSESYRRRVLLVDADLRRPSLARMFRIPLGRGLSESLRSVEERPLDIKYLSDSLALLPGGIADSDPMAGLTSGRMAEILREASAAFDWVILDTPPVGLLTDAHLLAAKVDAAVLVISAGVTPFAMVQRAIESIGRDKIVGAVLNRVEDSVLEDANYYSYSNASTGARVQNYLSRPRNDVPEATR